MSIGLVVLVMFLFLRRVRATLIPSVTIPVSLLSTCAVMYLFNYTIDNVSLMALTIAVGFIIDDAVVMVENIIRHIEGGKRPLEAALVGSREVGFTIVSMTLSLMSVFIPLLLMGGLIGRLFREFAVTVSMAILMSGVVSLTLTPMMCGWLLRPQPGRRSGMAHRRRFSRPPSSARSQSTTVSLRWALRHRLFMLAVMAATMAATVYLYVAISERLLSAAGQRHHIRAPSKSAQDISYAAMVERVHEMAKVVMADPDVQTVYYWVGANPTVNTGRMMIELKPFEPAQRDRDPGRRPPAKGDRAAFPASRSSARRARTCRSARASARRNTSTPCRIPTSPSCSNGRRSCWPSSPRCRNWRT